MKVLIGPNPYHLAHVIDQLEPAYPDIVFDSCDRNQDVSQSISDATVYLGWLTRSHSTAAKSIKWIQSPSTGVDRFLAIPELRNGKVILTSARGTHGPVLAEHTFAVILSFTRGVHLFADYQKKRRWMNTQLRSTLTELRGTTLGIVGFGTVGRAIADRAQGFDIRIIAVDVQDTPCPENVAWVGGLGRLDGLLAESDVVVVTVPFTDETFHMIDETRIGKMRTHAVLIGISRGGIIDENALAEALIQKRIRAAALDVFEHEPLPEDSPLWDIENLLITPHIGGGSQYETNGILDIFKMNLERFIQSDFPLHNQIDKYRGY